MFINRIHPS